MLTSEGLAKPRKHVPAQRGEPAGSEVQGGTRVLSRFAHIRRARSVFKG